MRMTPTDDGTIVHANVASVEVAHVAFTSVLHEGAAVGKAKTRYSSTMMHDGRPLWRRRNKDLPHSSAGMESQWKLRGGTQLLMMFQGQSWIIGSETACRRSSEKERMCLKIEHEHQFNGGKKNTAAHAKKKRG